MGGHGDGATREAAARLVEEVKASTALTDVTVPIREGEFWYSGVS